MAGRFSNVSPVFSLVDVTWSHGPEDAVNPEGTTVVWSRAISASHRDPI